MAESCLLTQIAFHTLHYGSIRGISSNRKLTFMLQNFDADILRTVLATSALIFRGFAPRLELLTLFRDFLGIFGKVWKCVKWSILLVYLANHIWFYSDIYHGIPILWYFDDICVFCPSVRWLQRILDMCQAYAESHGMIFNCNKTVCMTFKAKSAKSTVTPLLTLGGQNVKSVNQYKYLGIVLEYWALRWQRHSETTAISILCSKQAASLLFPMFKCT